MNEDALKYAERLVPHSYIDLARQARRSYEQKIRQIIEHRKLPDQPLEENIIEQWLNEIAQMDSNNFEGNIGVGEREGKQINKLNIQYLSFIQVVFIHLLLHDVILYFHMVSDVQVILMLFNLKLLVHHYLINLQMNLYLMQYIYLV
jgi:hypothetical protein